MRAPFPFAAGSTPPSSLHLPATVYSRICRRFSDTHGCQRGTGGKKGKEGKEEMLGREKEKEKAQEEAKEEELDGGE